MASKILFQNKAKSTLALNLTAAAVTAYLAPGEGTLFPSPGANEHFFAVIVRLSDKAYEVVKVTARATDTLTIVRAQEGTAARDFLAGDKLELRVTEGTLEAFEQKAEDATVTGNRTMDGLLKSTAGLTAQTAVNAVTLAGTDTYTASLSPALTAYVTDMRVLAHVTNANTGSCTINLNGLGAKTVKDGNGSALAAGTLPAGCVIEVRYDGTDFILMSVSTRLLLTNVPRRQTVLTGAVDSTTGQANFLSAGTGLAVTMSAAATAVRAAIAAGFDGYGQVDYLAQFSADQADYWSALPASNVSFLMLDRDSSTGAVSAYDTIMPPQYGAAFDKTKQALLHFEGADASTTMTDEYGNTWTAYGHAQIDTAQFKFGSSSLLLDGTGDSIQVSGMSSLYGAPWTKEVFIRPNSLAALGAIFSDLPTAASTPQGFILQLDTTGKLRLYASAASGSWGIASGVTGTATLSTGGWYHILASWDGTTYRVFVNGVLDISVASSSPVYSGTTSAVGAHLDNSESFNGHIDEVRFSPCARHVAAFTAPSTAYTPDAEWFDLSEFKWKYGAPGAWTEKQRVCVGEATTGAAAVSSATTYALRGKYKSPEQAVAAAGTKTTLNHNLGVVPGDVEMSAVCKTAELGYSQGGVRNQANFGGNGSNSYPYAHMSSRNSFEYTTGSSSSLSLANLTTGADAAATVANWRMIVIADRGW